MGVSVPAEKLFTMHSAVDVGEIAKIKADSELHRAQIRKQLGISQDTLIALSVGRLHPTKGHNYALEALPLLLKVFPNLHWVVLGVGGEKTQLDARVEELGVAHNAHLVGFVEDPLRFYAAADIFLRTMVLEGDNLSSCAAAAAELPVVGFATGNTSDLIPKVGHGIVVPNRDAAAMAAAASQILSLPDRGQSLGRLGADYCRDHLDIKQDVDNFVATYVALHQDRNRRPERYGEEIRLR